MLHEFADSIALFGLAIKDLRQRRNHWKIAVAFLADLFNCQLKTAATVKDGDKFQFGFDLYKFHQTNSGNTLKPVNAAKSGYFENRLRQTTRGLL